MIFFSIIAGMAQSLYEDTGSEVCICMGVHKSENAEQVTYRDCTPEFYEKVFEAFKEGNYEGKVKMYNPWVNKYKLDVLKDGMKACKSLNIDWEEFYKNTLSCYKPSKKGESCGKCPTCLERLKNFKDIKKYDPAPYVKK